MKLKNRFIFFTFSLFLMFFICCTDAQVFAHIQTEHVLWDKVPINFSVPLNTERMIIFDEPILLKNNDPALTTNKVSILNNDGVLYIKAKKVFDPIRLIILLKRTGRVVLVDLSGIKKGDDTPVKVLIKEEQENRKEQKEQKEQKNQKDQESQKDESMTYVRLMRYCIQKLYSPSRLIKEDPNINRTPMYTQKNVDLISHVIAFPLISFRGGNLVITAVLLKNAQSRNVKLRFRALKGRWFAASFYPANYLTKSGTKHDRTTVFLISDQSFNAALQSERSYR